MKYLTRILLCLGLFVYTIIVQAQEVVKDNGENEYQLISTKYYPISITHNTYATSTKPRQSSSIVFGVNIVFELVGHVNNPQDVIKKYISISTELSSQLILFYCTNGVLDSASIGGKPITPEKFYKLDVIDITSSADVSVSYSGGNLPPVHYETIFDTENLLSEESLTVWIGKDGDLFFDINNLKVSAIVRAILKK